MRVLLAEQIEYLESLGYAEPVGINDEIWAFHPGKASGVMPSPIPEAISKKAQQFQSQICSLRTKRMFERIDAWYRRHEQVEIWLHAFPFLGKFHCEGCGVIHYRESVPNHCDRCQEFLEQLRKDAEEIPF